MLFLVVDDDELSRELLAMLLESEGHEVEVVASGEEGLARLSGEAGGSRFQPDVILADIQMSGVSGSELACVLRTVSSGKKKLLAMSGSQPKPSDLTGFDGFLLKPFTMAGLTAVLKQEQPRGMAAAASAVPDDSDRSEEALPALNETILNETIHGQLAKSMTPVQLGQMYALCLSDTRTRVARMQELARVGDDEGYRKEAHTVKGGCGLIGATELYRLAEAAESGGLGTDGNADSGDGANSIMALLLRLSGACGRLERILGERA